MRGQTLVLIVQLGGENLLGDFVLQGDLLIRHLGTGLTEILAFQRAEGIESQMQILLGPMGRQKQNVTQRHIDDRHGVLVQMVGGVKLQPVDEISHCSF